MEYLQLAGRQAVQRSANAEAISHLTTALELLQTLPDTLERTRQELTLQIALGAPLAATKGIGAPEVGTVYNRARELCQQGGEALQLSRVLYALHRFYAVRAELQAAREIAEQHLRLAQSVQDPALLLHAHLTLGAAFLWLGEFAPAREYLEQGIASYDPQQHRSRAFVSGEHPGVTNLGFAAWALWCLGYPEQALKRSQEALTLARKLSYPYLQASALAFAAWSHQFRREIQLTQERAEAAIILASEQGFPLFLGWGTTLRGWVLAEKGQGKEGIAQLRQGLDAFRATGAELWRPYNLALLAESYGKIGQVKEGLKVVAEALATVDETGERFYEAELYRLQGELTLAQSRGQSLGASIRTRQTAKGKGRGAKITNPQRSTPSAQAEAEAEACFLKAIEIARHQQAKSLELRAATDLARLWQQQGKQKEAHELLSAIYGWFTEGFDTKDLQEAKTLLEELT